MTKTAQAGQASIINIAILIVFVQSIIEVTHASKTPRIDSTSSPFIELQKETTGYDQGGHHQNHDSNHHQQQQNQQHLQNGILPLYFEFAPENALKSRIYLNPLANIKSIKELASREVSYSENNLTSKIEEENGEWFTLVADDNHPSPRFALLKNEPCDEKDFRISWFDNEDKFHQTVTQRLGPSPKPWPNPPVKALRISNVAFRPETNGIVLSLAYDVSSAELLSINKSIDIIGSNNNQIRAQIVGDLTPVIRLTECKKLFDKPVDLPTVNSKNNTINMDVAYAQNECSFDVHMSILVFNKEDQCRDLLQTSDDFSAKISLSCHSAQGNLCPVKATDSANGPSKSPCSWQCDFSTKHNADYDYGRHNGGGGIPSPFVNFQWSHLNNQTLSAGDQKLTVIRQTQIDSLFNNFPLGEYNTSVQVISANGDDVKNSSFSNNNAIENSINLRPFSKNSESLFAIQICALLLNNYGNSNSDHDLKSRKSCENEARSISINDPLWTTAPKYAVFVSNLVNALPPPSTIKPTTTASLTFPTSATTPDSSVIDSAKKMNHSQHENGIEENNLATPSPPLTSPDNNGGQQENNVKHHLDGSKNLIVDNDDDMINNNNNNHSQQQHHGGMIESSTNLAPNLKKTTHQVPGFAGTKELSQFCIVTALFISLIAACFTTVY